MAYLSDHCPTALGPGPDGLGEYHEAALALARDCDLLVHDAQYLDEELERRASFGHAAAGYAVRLAGRAHAGQVLLYHHDPPRTDDEIDAVVASYAGGPVPVGGAAEGMVVDLPALRHPEKAGAGTRARWPTVRGHGRAGRAGGGQLPRT